MNTRLSRAEQNDRNRALLFAAARRVFLARGYHAATLEQIADEAGFSKGVVYSRFASKADLFLALLEDRITEFRIHAARDPELNRRYAALHARTVEGIAAMMALISERGAEHLPFPPRQLAELVLAVETGLALELQADPGALGGPDLPVIRWLTGWFASAPVLTSEER